MQSYETRSVPETRDEPNDPIASAVAAVAELRTASTELGTRLEERVTSGLKGLTDRLDEIETRAARPNFGRAGDISPERRAFESYLRGGLDRVPAEQRAVLQVSSDAQGGYLVPPEASLEFIRDLVEFSPLRSLATVRQTSSSSITFPRRIGRSNAAWKGELQAATESAPTFGQFEIAIRELASYYDISNQLLSDGAVNVEAEVRLGLAEDFGLKEAAAFVSGDGTLSPIGFLNGTELDYFPNGHATMLSTDALISFLYSFGATYRNRGTWLMNGTTLAAIRKLKDSQGQYLWQPSLAAGLPETLLGRPVAEDANMPDIASGAFPIAYGDWATGYLIVDRLDMSVLVNPFLLATTSTTRFHATRRTGGAVRQKAALKKFKMATS